MSKIGLSTFAIGNLFIDTSGFRGPTGPTGPVGPTGPTGPTGNKGLTGIGVDYILKNGNDGVTVYLTTNQTFDIIGISGNTFDNNTTKPYYYTIAGATGVIPNQSFEIKGAVNGLTATFKTIKTIGGLTANYSGNDLVFSTSSGTVLSIGVAGCIPVGNTANTIISGPDINAFEYRENTVGLTTVPLVKGKLSNFIQRSVIRNENVNNTNTLSSIISGNTYNISFSQYKLTSTDVTNRTTDTTEYGKVLLAGQTLFRKSVSTNYVLFRDLTSNKTTYQNYEYGSCCFCDGTNNSTKCIDYVISSYCSSLNGNFSVIPCQNRTETACIKIGKCCAAGKCIDTDKTQCDSINGTFTPNAICSAPTCP